MASNYSSFGAKPLEKLLDEGADIIGVVISTKKYEGAGTFKTLIKYIREFGIRPALQKVFRIFILKLRIIARTIGIPLSKGWLNGYQCVEEILVDKPLLLYTPNNVNERKFIKDIKDLKIDLIISCGFREILKKEILVIPRIGSINVHPSLLPKYRGPYPLFWALYNGEAHTGITIHEIAEKIDSGGIFAQSSVVIDASDDENTLRHKLGEVAAIELANLIKNDRIKNLKPIPQLEVMSSYQGKPTIKERKELRKKLRRRKNMEI